MTVLRNKTVVFVGGAYGSGKSFLCSEIEKRIASKHVTASELLSPADRTGKAVSNVDLNQTQILGALARLDLAADLILLDGHYAILSADGSIVPVAVDTFKLIDPRLLILVESTPERVLSRLKARGDLWFTEQLVSGLIAAERNRATLVSDRLGLPLFVWTQALGVAAAVRFIQATLGP